MFSTLLVLSPLTPVLVCLIFVVTYVALALEKQKKSVTVADDGLLEPPSPKKLPIIGHMHLLGGVEVPYQAFSKIGEKYGNVVRLQLGNVKCVVVNDQKNIREALVTKGHHFDSRPNFQRYQQLFSGNKENSLAFCDWSETQKIRRDMLKAYTFPRAFTNKYYSLESLISEGTASIISQIKPEGVTELKPLILKNCANIFLNHFCSKKFDLNNNKFVTMIENFDEIFYEVNQGYAADFLPFLMPLHKNNLERINKLTHQIRDFILDEVIEDRFDEMKAEAEPNDYVESLIKHVKTENSDLEWETALFALEDILGGHSAVGNFLMKMFAFLAKEVDVQKKIQKEIDDAVGSSRSVAISDRSAMPYTEATVFEAIRLIASPIVPRVANQDSSVDGYKIEKGSVLFLNNYDLSMSDKLWNDPTQFQPERFIKDDKIVKPEYFLPFGGGRRSCMGYKIVQLVSFGILGGILQNFTILPETNCDYKVPVGSLALPKNTFKFKFSKR